MTSKKKLLIILGAGSSQSLGLPSVRSLGQSMKIWSQEWREQPEPEIRNSENFFDRLWDAAERYYRSSKRSMNPKLQPQVTYEKVLGEMLSLAHWMVPAPYGTSLRQIACNNAPPPDLLFPYYDESTPHGPAILINTQLSHLLGRLAKHMRGLCGEFDETVKEFQSYKGFLAELVTRFDVGLYNLNYDNMVVRAWPEAFTGFAADGMFDTEAVHARSEWGFIYHLHGSVHHTLAEEFSHTIRWQKDLKAKFFDNHKGRWSDTRSDGRPHPMSTLIAGAFKLDQLLVEPFQSFYSTLIRHVYEADAVLIGGYGFGDAHMNRALQNRLRQCTERNISRPPVMIIDRSEEKTPGVIPDDLWNRDMCHNLGTDNMLCATENGFRVFRTHKIAVCLDGFSEGASRLDAILSWLGDASEQRQTAQPRGT
jgi:hypothetical protein